MAAMVSSASPKAIASVDCRLRVQDRELSVRDLSQIGVVVADDAALETLKDDERLVGTLALGHQMLSVVLRRGEVGAEPGTVLLRFAGLPASVAAELRFFLAPKRVGESLRHRWVSGAIRCAYGWNGGTLLWDEGGETFFGIVDLREDRSQLCLWLPESRSTLKAGIVARERFVARLRTVAETDSDRGALGDRLGLRTNELPFVALNEREAFSRVAFCRDVVTNFRPANPAEGAIKMRLLRAMSEAVYSAAHKASSNAPRGSLANAR